MSESQESSQPTRRAVIRAGVAGAVAVAAGAGSASFAAKPARADSGTHILAGIGATQTSYSPAITARPSKVTLHAEQTFVPALPSADNPLLLLVSNRLDGTIQTSCLGGTTDPNLNGTLRWSDGTVSSYHINTMTAERVEGHAVGRLVGNVSNGHHQGAVINILGIKLAGDLTACLTGGGISSSTGFELVILTMP